MRSRHGQRLLLVVGDEDQRHAELASAAASARTASAGAACGRARRAARRRAAPAGRMTSARASATRCCWPPESWPGWRSSRPVERHLLQRRLHARARSRPCGTPRMRRPKADVLGHGAMRKQRVGLEHHAHVALVHRQSVMSRPPTWTRPSSGSSKPAIMRSVVVLPQPDGPSSEKNSPAAMSSVTSSTATTRPSNVFVTSSNVGSRRKSVRGGH